MPRRRSSHLHRSHAPRRRGIQYAAAYGLNHNCLGVLDRPVKPGDDTECVASAFHNLVIASVAKQSRLPLRKDSGLLRRISAKLLRNFVASSSQ
ncbi:hypothetical protein EAS61_00410 [Bradyrhizobium zhanjiangense]|uniref:Uncharacterized protein n=1 Tax=Bradyrhizobium zhanjiangense TaxID=1325107 RepID=A0A4Q0R018_9BRAD|nr:hypothetical protein EAS61_00410 [Bradyrhizobium zhanjiangense]